MTPQLFDALARQGYNRIPLVREVCADLDTPLSAYLKLADAPYSYLFESVQGGEKWGRYSIIGLPCRTIVRVFGHDISVEKDGGIAEQVKDGDPLTWIEQFQARYKIAPAAGLPRFTGGLVGYFGYDTVRYIEQRLAKCTKPDAVGTPDILLMVSDEVVVFDNLSGKLYLVIHVNPAIENAWNKAHARLDELCERLQRATPRPSDSSATPVRETDFVSGFTQAGFEEAVAHVKHYIVEGDIMQVVLSQRLSAPYQGSALNFYRALRTLNPSPYMFHLNLSDFHVVGSSPEILTRLEDGVITVRPIAGTRKRGITEAEDRALEAELLADPKERAEHLMLIDLGRNDVGRVAETGSVKLTEKMIIERYSHVMHIVSNVAGRLKKGMTALDALRATFPAGTVSGAPKIRAMEIIDELEPVKRGVYSGAVGYLGWNGNMDTAIAIRTAVLKDGMLHVQAGAGIVADSVPRQEWEETMNKARALVSAAVTASKGLDVTPVLSPVEGTEVTPCS
jgi:anthranilate synthase component 1